MQNLGYRKKRCQYTDRKETKRGKTEYEPRKVRNCGSVLYYIITLRAVFYADYGYFLFYHIHTVWCIHAPYHYRTLLRRIQGGGLCNDSI